MNEIPIMAYNLSYQNSLNKFRNLSILNLDYFNVKCDNTQLFDLGNLLLENQAIEEIYLNFSKCKNINDEGVSKFFQCLS